MTKLKEEYFLIGGISGIISSVAMMAGGFLFPKTPIGFSNLTVFGFLSLAISVGGEVLFLEL